MKNKLLFIVMLFCSFGAMAQEKSLTLSGGYVFTNIEDSDTDADGFRINGLFELNPQGGRFSHGFSMGYIHTSASNTVLDQTIDYKITTLPAYYAPKLSFGNESFKVFLKGALGIHFSHYKRTGDLTEITDWDAGFYGGAGLGITKSINEKFFLGFEYEWNYMSNTAYVDGFVNSVMIGVGIKL